MITSPTTIALLKFVRNTLELNVTPFQENLLDAIIKSARPATERVILRSRDGLELATKIAYGVSIYARPLVPSIKPINPKSTLAASLFEPRSREYMDCGLRRIDPTDETGRTLRIFEER